MVKKQTPKKSHPTKPHPQDQDAQAQNQDTSSPPAHFLDLKTQQRLLNLFSDAFGGVLASDEFPALLQGIKQALFRRDFDAAFGRQDYLQAYAARWSPTRALCYAEVLRRLGGYFDGMAEVSPLVGRGDVAGEMEEASFNGREMGQGADPTEGNTSVPSASKHKIKMLSIGGCAAEHIAFAAYLSSSSISSGSLTLLDSAPWTNIISLLQNQITSPPPLSKYASTTAKATNHALLNEGQLSVAFQQRDVLSLQEDELKDLVAGGKLVVTLLFTLNELYSNGGIGKTTAFLKRLGKVLPGGSLLLVVDSPGSYSEAAVGKDKKRYPMQWLLDHTLLEMEAGDNNKAGQRPDEEEYRWERLESHDSIWFRLPEGVSYPIPLENMRYQMHLYRRENRL